MFLALTAVSLLFAAYSPSMTVTHTRDANGRGFWVAKNHNVELWRYRSFRPTEVHLQESGITVIGIIDSSAPEIKLVIVDRNGRIRSKLPLSSANDPRVLLCGKRYLVYDSGILGIAYYQTRDEGIATEKWLNQVRRVSTYNLMSFLPVRNKPELAVGQPLCFQRGYLESLRILNISRCLQNDWWQSGAGNISSGSWHFPVRPQIALVEQEIKTGRIRRIARLRLSRTQARNLYNYVLGVNPIASVTVRWSRQYLRMEGIDRDKHLSYISYQQAW